MEEPLLVGQPSAHDVHGSIGLPKNTRAMDASGPRAKKVRERVPYRDRIPIILVLVLRLDSAVRTRASQPERRYIFSELFETSERKRGHYRLSLTLPHTSPTTPRFSNEPIFFSKKRPLQVPWLQPCLPGRQCLAPRRRPRTATPPSHSRAKQAM